MKGTKNGKQGSSRAGAGMISDEVEITIRLPREEYEAAKELCDAVRVRVEEVLRDQLGVWLDCASIDDDLLLSSVMNIATAQKEGRSPGFQRMLAHQAEEATSAAS